MDYVDRSHQWGRFITSGLVLSLMGLGYLAVVYAVAGQVVVEKALLHLAMPAGVVWILLTFICLQLRDCRTSPLFLVAVVAWLAFTVLGSGHLKSFLIGKLESNYIGNRPLEATKPFEAIVVLGGGCSLGANGETQINSAGERVVLAAKMYHAGLTKKLVCTGKRIKLLDPEGSDPAERSERMLLQLNVPPRAIEKIGGINTSEEMRELAKRFKGQKRIGLITSAWHMNRAMRLADSSDLKVLPLPGGFKSRQKREWTAGRALLSVIPNSEALSNTTWALREFLAGFVGR